MARGIEFSTKVSGPFFELKGLPIKDASAATIQDLLKEGEAKVKAQLTAGHGLRTGVYRSTVAHKFVRSTAHATGWGSVFGGKEYPNNIKGRWIEGGTRRNLATRYKGIAVFRKAVLHLRRLANQMAGRHYKRAVQRLT